MKKMLLAVLVVALIGTVAIGQQVLSRNAVGYTKVVANKGFNLIRNDFYPLGVSATPSNLFGLTTFPTNTVLYIWDAAGSKYNFESLGFQKGIGTLWAPNTNLLTPGKGVWINIPTTAPSNSYTAYMMGEVPDRNNMGAGSGGTAVVYIIDGFNLIGYPFPAEVLWTNTDLAKQAVTGDVLWTWNGAGYGFNQYAFQKGVGTIWSQPTQVLYVAQGYWYQRAVGNGALTWREPKPYTWP
jgi:hypothetical protein